MASGDNLKPFLPYLEDPLNLMRYRYKYVSADKEYYILAFFFIDDDHVSKVSWSKYRYGSDIAEKENMIGLDKDFDNMIDSEDWTREGAADATIAQ